VKECESCDPVPIQQHVFRFHIAVDDILRKEKSHRKSIFTAQTAGLSGLSRWKIARKGSIPGKFSDNH
jgi:hypothetical protein